MDDDSVDSIVTDPPAGIGFMGKSWDMSKGGRDKWIEWMQEVAEECRRVMKPGGHALVWTLPRTSHWTATAWENAGWEVRDKIAHIFGTGFPKALDVSKEIDKKFGAERKEINKDISEQWNGWKTALKPAREDWLLLRSPIEKKTVVDNILKHGTGAINIDACRIVRDPNDISGWSKTGSKESENLSMSGKNYNRDPKPDNPAGRFPANVIFDEFTAGILDEQSGILAGDSPNRKPRFNNTDQSNNIVWTSKREHLTPRHADSGGASRYFYTYEFEEEDFAPFFYSPKPSQKEKNCGCNELPDVSPVFGNSKGDGLERGISHTRQDVPRKNNHPTVKSIKLMRYLCKLVTPHGGVVLDPFAGSGSTLIGAMLEGFSSIGIEESPDYCRIALARLAYYLPF